MADKWRGNETGHYRPHTPDGKQTGIKIMNQIEAQKKIIEAIKANPENVIAKALAFNPSIKDIVSDAQFEPVTLEDVADIACRLACNGSDNGKTIFNMLNFADTL